MESDFMTVAEVAQRLRITPKRAYVVLAAGKACPVTRIGRRVLVPRAAWDTWYSRHVERALAACEEGGRMQAGSASEEQGEVQRAS
jgi:excisionase family DNA binding protein